MIISKYKPSKAIQKSKSANCGAGYLTVINSKNNGRRIELRKEVADKLKLEDAISVAYDSESAILFKPTDDFESVSFKACKQSSKSVVYSCELVAELTQFFELDFSDRVSYTFVDGVFEVDEESGQQILVIKKKSNKEQLNATNETVNTEREEVTYEK